jgi:maltooligosyltrehalose trehalohydrolase
VGLADLVLYELHVGTFSPSGTFDAIVPRLPALRDLGVTAIELMPIAAFPGERNWGYDGVCPFAVQETYGGVAGLQRLVNAAHASGLGVFVDVVYNHLGPEGNYLDHFGPYFTDEYRTPWGRALNFDGPDSDPVRRYFIESATYLVRAAHLDGLRVDAVHAILDRSARPFLAELTDAVHRERAVGSRMPVLIAESALNDPRVARSESDGGLGFDAFWNDDFHHALHTALTGERDGYYVDFDGVADLARVLSDGFALDGRYSRYRRRRHGIPLGPLASERLVVAAQNHDQVGNRSGGERLSALVSFEALKLAAGVLLLSPYRPLLFMGEEYGEPAPFLFFTSHSDPEVIAGVRRGRLEEAPPEGGASELIDPQAESTFARSRIDFTRRERLPHRALWELHRTLLRLRRDRVPPVRLATSQIRTGPEEAASWISLQWSDPTGADTCAAFHFGPEVAHVDLFPSARGLYRLLDSSDTRWAGPGAASPGHRDPGERSPIKMGPWSFALYSSRPEER